MLPPCLQSGLETGVGAGVGFSLLLGTGVFAGAGLGFSVEAGFDVPVLPRPGVFVNYFFFGFDFLFACSFK
ncbi:hypothetical protein [Paenibacillus larvae]|uniref:hypothetical protein n=1 Tax=Paenibacillus larvae TaxID=1464 RepID=UPI001F1A92E4|nr:hypothetical protein [Paenibacillus larvae]